MLRFMQGSKIIIGLVHNTKVCLTGHECMQTFQNECKHTSGCILVVVHVCASLVYLLALYPARDTWLKTGWDLWSHFVSCFCIYFPTSYLLTGGPRFRAFVLMKYLYSNRSDVISCSLYNPETLPVTSRPQHCFGLSSTQLQTPAGVFQKQPSFTFSDYVLFMSM